MEWVWIGPVGGALIGSITTVLITRKRYQRHGRWEALKDDAALAQDLPEGAAKEWLLRYIDIRLRAFGRDELAPYRDWGLVAWFAMWIIGIIAISRVAIVTNDIIFVEIFGFMILAPIPAFLYMTYELALKTDRKFVQMRGVSIPKELRDELGELREDINRLCEQSSASDWTPRR